MATANFGIAGLDWSMENVTKMAKPAGNTSRVSLGRRHRSRLPVYESAFGLKGRPMRRREDLSGRTATNHSAAARQCTASGKHGMRRRSFLALLGGAAATWPLPARAQQPALPVVTFINARSADVGAALAVEFRKGLSQTGFAEGKNVLVEYHWLDGHYEATAAILEDAVRRNVAVIATPGNSPATLAAKAATTTIPIVFGVGEDPVVLGLVASLAHPGGNVTGINFFASEIDAKRIGLMREMLPNARRFAVLINPGNATTAGATSNALKEAAPGLGLDLLFLGASTPAEIDTAFASIARERADGLFISPDAFFTSRSAQLVTLSARDRIPTSVFSTELVAAGLLMGYGTSLTDVFRQVGVYAGSILGGAKPADLPVLQSTKFEFSINLQTARSFGVPIPATLLARADEVFE
jgi:putative ABC transport system substrate-binding protein